MKDGLEGLENLRTLNLSGNHIDSYEEFYKLKSLENLQNLILNDVTNKSATTASNPLCSKFKDYRYQLSQILPRCELIDGESFRPNAKHSFKQLDETLSRSLRESSKFFLKFFLTIFEADFLFLIQNFKHLLIEVLI
jgi:hypothetical protein